MRSKRQAAWALAVSVLFSMGCVSSANAQAYGGNQRINLIIGYGPGGGYDTYARFVAQTLGRHLPGSPEIVPQNMPGAGSLKAANYLYNIAPRDGTTIGTVSQSIAFMRKW